MTDTGIENTMRRMIAIHKSARNYYWVYMALLLLIAAGLAALVYTAKIPFLPGVIGSIITACAAIVPWRHAVERNERIEGLSVLSEEWQEISLESGSEGEKQFVRFLQRLYIL